MLLFWVCFFVFLRSCILYVGKSNVNALPSGFIIKRFYRAQNYLATTAEWARENPQQNRRGGRSATSDSIDSFHILRIPPHRRCTEAEPGLLCNSALCAVISRSTSVPILIACQNASPCVSSRPRAQALGSVLSGTSSRSISVQAGWSTQLPLLDDAEPFLNPAGHWSC